MSYKDLDFDWLEKIIIPAIDLFYDTLTDKDLMDRDASERTVVANIYCKMNELFKKEQGANEVLRHLSIDVEYNRNAEDPKKTYQKCFSCQEQGCFNEIYDIVETGAIPDILIHQRGSNEDNQVAIEFKKVSNRGKEGRRKDITKLTYLTCQQPYRENEKLNYKYRYGCFIDLGIDSYTIALYQNSHLENTWGRQRGNYI